MVLSYLRIFILTVLCGICAMNAALAAEVVSAKVEDKPAVEASRDVKDPVAAFRGLRDIPITYMDVAGKPLPEILIGAPDAPITMVQYMSQGCRSCAKYFLEIFPHLLASYVRTGWVKVVHRTVPRPDAPNDFSIRAAQIERCFPLERFTVISGLLYSQLDYFGTDDYQIKLTNFAVKRGLTNKQVEACFADSSVPAMLEVTRAEADEYFGVRRNSTILFADSPLRTSRAENPGAVAKLIELQMVGKQPAKMPAPAAASENIEQKQ